MAEIKAEVKAGHYCENCTSYFDCTPSESCLCSCLQEIMLSRSVVAGDLQGSITYYCDQECFDEFAEEMETGVIENSSVSYGKIKPSAVKQAEATAP